MEIKVFVYGDEVVFVDNKLKFFFFVVKLLEIVFLEVRLWYIYMLSLLL